MDATQRLVVIVEDDAGMRQALQRLLHASGYRTQAFESAEALLAAGGAQGAHCLVLDVQLPGASGIQLYARLGRDRPPAVFITSHDASALRSAAAAVGVAVVLPKPFLGHELTDAIALATGQGGLP